MGSKYGQAPNYGNQYNCINNGIGALQGCSSGFGGSSWFGRRLEDGTPAADEAAANNSTDDGIIASSVRVMHRIPIQYGGSERGKWLNSDDILAQDPPKRISRGH